VRIERPRQPKSEGRDILARIVAREAGKLDRASSVGIEELTPDQLARLEILSRCAKTLGPGDPESVEVEETDEATVQNMIARAGES
jgi:hypothetical protein